MKKALIILAFCSLAFTGEDYRQGWEDGYCEGWKDVRGQYVICPVTPVAPVPLVNQDTYRGGYNRGFKRGQNDAEY